MKNTGVLCSVRCLRDVVLGPVENCVGLWQGHNRVQQRARPRQPRLGPAIPFHGTCGRAGGLFGRLFQPVAARVVENSRQPLPQGILPILRLALMHAQHACAACIRTVRLL